MKLEEIRTIAEEYRDILAPYCHKAEIAGSIRRCKANPNDIEIVCLVDPEYYQEFAREVNSWKKIKGEPTGKYTQRLLPEGVTLDLFIAEKGNFGNILLIRTGSKEFSKQIMGIAANKRGFRHIEGYLWKEGQRFPCLSEKDVFWLLKLPYVEPKDRG